MTQQPKDFVIRDSGKRESYDGGAVRDVREDKGRYDLITPYGLKRLALVYERGARKYSDRNWEKGMPFSRFIDSAIRHIQQYIEGDTVEDHLGQAAWNLFSIMHLQATRPELDDMPHYKERLCPSPEPCKGTTLPMSLSEQLSSTKGSTGSLPVSSGENTSAKGSSKPLSNS